MRDRLPSASNGLANVLMLAGFVLLVAGGVSAYPAVRDALGLAGAPEGFGDEAALSASIVDANEAQPALASETGAADPAPLVLPETPLQSEVTPVPEVVAPTPEPTPVAAPTATAPPIAEFAPEVPSRIVSPAIDLDAPVVTVGWSVVTQNGQQLSLWDGARPR